MAFRQHRNATEGVPYSVTRPIADLNHAPKISLDAAAFFATLPRRVHFLPGDLLMKESCRDCLGWLVSPLPHPSVACFAVVSLNVGCCFHEQRHDRRRRRGVFEARLDLEPRLLPPSRRRPQNPGDFIVQPRPSLISLARRFKRDWPAILLPPAALDGIAVLAGGDLASGRRLSDV